MGLLTIHGNNIIEGTAPVIDKSYIFKNGEFNPIYFSGFVEYAYAPSGTSGFAANKNTTSEIANQILITNDYDLAYGSTISAKAINMSDLSSISVNVTDFNASYTKYNPSADSIEIIITNQLAQNYTRVKSVSVKANGTYNIDVSDLNGEYYLCFFLKTYQEQGRIKFDEISCTLRPKKYLFKDGNLKQHQRTYLYNKGTQVVPWDNTGRLNQAGWTSMGGWTLGSEAMTATTDGGSGARCRAIMTDSMIDLTPYKFLCISFNSKLFRYNISGLSNGYIVLCDQYGSYQALIIYIASKKDLFADNPYKNFNLNTYDPNITFPVSVDAVWLESEDSFEPADNNAIKLDDNLYQAQATVELYNYGWSLDSTNMNIYMYIGTDVYRCISLLSNELLDLSDYSVLKVEYSYGTSGGTATVNIASISNGYVGIVGYADKGNRININVGVYSSKLYWLNNTLASTVLDQKSASVVVNITKIWLE